jgi:hypothetical protein
VLLDYACTDSCLDLSDWLTLENISRDLFWINVRNTTYFRTHPFGHPQPWWRKVFVQGGGLFVLLISFILVPFFIFSTSNPQVGVLGVPTQIPQTLTNIKHIAQSITL